VRGAGFTCYALQAKVQLCVPACNRHIGWLIATDGRSLAIPGEETQGIAIPVRLEHGEPAGMVKLQHSLRRRHYLGLHGNPSELGFRNKMQEFRLDPIDATPAIVDIAAELTAAVQTPATWMAILDALRSHLLRSELADAALRCLPPDEVDALARHLLEDPHDLAMLQAAMRGDPWLQQRLPLLISWRQPQTPARILGPVSTADLPGAKANPSHRITLGLTLNAYARAATRPQRMACILATARNEGAYLIEWIAYHRAIGFDHIFLYTNDNTDGSDDLLQLLADAGVISWFRNQVQPDTLPQHRAYGHALSVMPEILDYRWTMIADIDEFAGFDTSAFGSMPDYILWQEQRRAEAIALSWKLYVASPNDVWRDRPSIERFTLREAALDAHVKMIFRTNMAWNANPHHPEPRLGASLIYRSERGEPYVQKVTPAQSAAPSAKYAWISHYAFRSAPEMLMKLARGRADLPGEVQSTAWTNRIKTFLRQIGDSGLIEDRSTLLCGAKLVDEQRRLLTIPCVAACETDIKHKYQASMLQTCNEFIETIAGGKSAVLSDIRKILRPSQAA
jgi:hypothetical protein